MIAIRLFCTLFICSYLSLLSAHQAPLVSTESDPDAFIQNCVNVINGDYCETATDLLITGPDPLILQRFYSTKDPITGCKAGGWKIFPQRFLVIGKDRSDRSCKVGKEQFEWTSAFVGERSGWVLHYTGWRGTNKVTKDPLKIDILNHGTGIVNSYAKEINGQTNRHNNQLHCKGNRCELTLGDGTKRLYKQSNSLPFHLLGEEVTPLMTSQVVNPSYFLLIEEILPSGNQLFFNYDKNGHLISVEMKNKSNKVFSWIHLSYEFSKKGCQVHIKTSDARKLTYTFLLKNSIYQLTQVEGTHCIPVSYKYDETLIRKNLPEGRFVEIEYNQGKVQSLKGPNAQSGKAEVVHSFSYGKGYTDVFDAMRVKTRYCYDTRLQLTAIERYDEHNTLYSFKLKMRIWAAPKPRVETIANGSIL